MKHITVFFALLVAVSLVLSGCAPAATEAPPPQAQPTTAPPPEATPVPAPLVLKIANTANITTWDPVASFSTESEYIANVYEQLLRINPPGSAERFTPLLATSWESNTDGTEWTFHLRQNVKFHDGTPMDSAAVKKSIEAAQDHAGASFIWLPLDTIEAPDASTVVFKLKYAAPVDLIASSLYGAWIVSPKALDAAAADKNYWNNGADAGTGPYTIDSYKPDQEIVFKKFADYWGGWQPNQYDTVLVSIVPEATTQQQMFEAGDVDLMTRIPQENYASFKDNPQYTYLEEPSFYNYIGFFNTTKKPLDDVKVRQALSYAIPYDDIIKIGAQGLGTQSRGPVPAGVWPWSKDVNQYTYDLEKAKALLKEAGHEGGKFSVNITYASENDTEAGFAPLIKDSFAQIGVDATLTPMEFTQQWALAKADPAKAQDMFLLLYWPTYSDAGSDNLWSMFYGDPANKPSYLNVTAFNLSYWMDDEYNKLLDAAIGETVSDATQSQADYVSAMNRLVDQAPGVFFMDTKAVFIIPAHIGGFKYNLNYPFVHYFFYELHPAE
jgi:peptide/nickel transport system substrate-binding protein